MKKLESTFLNMISVLTAVTVICAFAVSFVYKKTLPTIEENEKKQEISAINAIFGEEYDNDPIAEKAVVKISKNGTELDLYPLRKDGTIYALAIKSYSRKGFGGDINMMVGFNLDGTMAGYNILQHKETPGLGTKVTEEKFMSQFRGSQFSGQDLALKKDGGDIDGVTSATVTSRAVIDGIKRAKKAYNKFSAGIEK